MALETAKEATKDYDRFGELFALASPILNTYLSLGLHSFRFENENNSASVG